MGRILSIAGIIFSILFFSSFTQKPDSTTVKKSSSTEFVKEMTKRSFIKEVYDYRRKSTPWLYKGKKPAVIVLYANWCSPCRQMSTIVSQLAEEYNGKVRFFKINIDNEKELCDYWKADYIPLFIFIPMYEEPQRQCGTMDKDVLRAKIDNILFN